MKTLKESLINRENIKRLYKENMGLLYCIPEDHRENAIAYTIDYKLCTRNKAIEELRKNNISYCFMWNETIEGVEFWSKVSKEQKIFIK